MAQQIISDEVYTLLNLASVEGALLDLSIAQAEVFGDDLLSTLSTNLLKLVKTYLAAHFYTLSAEKGALASTELGEAKDRFHNVYSKGFGTTRFGMQAIAMDTTGTLARASTKVDAAAQQAEFRVV